MSGLFWPKRGLWRQPGVAVVEFLPAIPAGNDPREFLTRWRTVETRSNQLMADAGFTLPDPPTAV